MPARKPTVAIVEDDKELAALWQRRAATYSGFNVVSSHPGSRASLAPVPAICNRRLARGQFKPARPGYSPRTATASRRHLPTP